MSLKQENSLYSEAEAATKLQNELPSWKVQNGMLVRVYRTHGWKATMLAVNAIAHLAEAAWHHPDLYVTFAAVEVRLQTHDAGGITDKDFALAKKIEDIVLWQPARENGALTGIPENDASVGYLKYDKTL